MKKSNLQIALSYLNFLWKSKGIGSIHSPFVFSLLDHIKKHKKEDFFEAIENERNKFLRNSNTVQGNDFGAGSRIKSNKMISNIAKRSLKGRKEAQLLFKITDFLKPQSILELGTSLGISCAYLAHTNKNARVYSLEGNAGIIKEAKQLFQRLQLKNITIIEGNIDESLAIALQQTDQVDFAFIDANHRKEPCLRYFNQIMHKTHNDSAIIVDDIHWSFEMEEAWKDLKADPRVKVSLDLFHFGILFLKEELSPQEFTIRI